MFCERYYDLLQNYCISHRTHLKSHEFRIRLISKKLKTKADYNASLAVSIALFRFSVNADSVESAVVP